MEQLSDHRDHRFESQGAWGSKLVTIAGYRCIRCGLLYVRANRKEDESGRIFAIADDGRVTECAEIEATPCNRDVRHAETTQAR